MTVAVIQLTDETIGKDCSITTTGGGNNNNGTTVIIGNPASGGYRHNGLITYPLTSIPLAATVNAAYISLFITSNNSNGSDTFLARRCKRNWHETQANYWGWDSSNGWQAQWCRGADDADGTALASCVIAASPAGGTECQFVFSTYGKAELKKMYDGTYTNYGFHFCQSTAEDASHAFQHSFGSSSHATPGYRPSITIDYYMPGGGMILWTSQFKKWSEKKRRLMNQLMNQGGRLVGAQI